MTIYEKILCFVSFLSEENKKRLVECVDSPFFNTHENLSEWVKGLLIFEDKLKGEEPWEEAYFWEVIFPNQEFSIHRKYRLYRKVVVLLEDFLVTTQALDSFFYRKKTLINYYMEHQCHELAQEEIGQYEAKLRKVAVHDTFYLDAAIEIEGLKVTQSWQFEQRGKFPTALFSPLIKALDNYYYAYRLQLCAHLQYIEGMQLSKDNIYYIQHTLSQIEQNITIWVFPHVQAYYYLVKMFQTSTDFSQKIIAVISKHEQEFPLTELTSIYARLRGFYTFEAQKGDKDALSTIYNLYKTSIEKGWVYDQHGYIIPNVFLNFLQYSIYFYQNPDFLPQLIEEYSSKIAPTAQESCLLIAEAIAAFVGKNYELVLYNVRTAKMLDVMISLKVRRLEMKTYFEMGDIDSLTNSVNTFRVFIQRCENLQKHIVQANRNFASEVYHLLNAAHIGTAISKKAEIRLKKMDFLVEYWWLKEKWKC